MGIRGPNNTSGIGPWGLKIRGARFARTPDLYSRKYGIITIIIIESVESVSRDERDVLSRQKRSWQIIMVRPVQ